MAQTMFLAMQSFVALLHRLLSTPGIRTTEVATTDCEYFYPRM